MSNSAVAQSFCRRFDMRCKNLIVAAGILTV